MNGLPGVSVLRAALGCRCPRCGQGKLFAGLLHVRPACEVCGLDFTAQDAGNGPAVFVILLLGLIVVGSGGARRNPFFAADLGASGAVDPFILGGAIAMLRPLKAGLIALQFRHDLLVAPRQS